MGLFSSKPTPAEEAAADAVTTLIGQKLAQRGAYEQVMSAGTAQERVEIEAAFDRHAAVQRDAGQPGW
jgi:predicted ATPase